MIYNVVYWTMAALSIAAFGDRRGQMAFYYASLTFLFVFSAFRYEVGCDFYSYLRHSLVNGPVLTLWDVLTHPEPAYWFTVMANYQLGLAFPAINIEGALMFFAGLHVLARRQPIPLTYIAIQFPFLICGVGMATVRQGMAMLFVALAFEALIERRLLRFLAFVASATAFHASAMVFLIMAPFVRNELRLSWRALPVPLALMLPLIYLVGTSEAADQYSSAYVNTAIDAVGGTSRAGLLFGTGLSYLLFLRKAWREKLPEDYQLVTLGSVLMVLVLPLAFYSSVLGDRFGYYLNLIQGIIFCKAYLLFDRPGQRFAVQFIPYLIYGAALFVWTQNSWIFGECYGDYMNYLWFH